MTNLLALLLGWLADLLAGDPQRLPHPVVGFGKAIAACERRLNHGSRRQLKGAVTAVGLIAAVFLSTWAVRRLLGWADAGLCPLPLATTAFDAVLIFYCLAGTTLIREVRQVFLALDRSLDDGRRQVARIVGRDTSELTAQEVRTAALETLAENLSDGVVAPLFWLALGGTPAMMAYKMVNTLDSMIGYRTDRYRQFGCWAARIDDVVNYVPARLTAWLMVLGAWLLRLKPEGRPSLKLSELLRFVAHDGPQHASPNSGWPEAALAAILDCRFGGPHHYFGQLFPKPYIGRNDRPLTTADMQIAVRVNRAAEVMAVVIVGLALCGSALLLG